MYKTKTKTITVLVLLAIIALITYSSMPILAYGFYGLPFLLIILSIISFGYFSFKEPEDSYSEIKIEFNLFSKISLGILGISLFLFTLLPIASSWSAFYSKDYRNLIGKVEHKIFQEDQAPIDVSQIRIVDELLARKLGDKKLGEDIALGSSAQLGDFYIQRVKNKLFWIAPIEHSGFFKWLNNRKGTPGYIMVSATNEKDVRFIRKINGKDIFIKYQNGSYFNENIKRYIYVNGYFNKGVTDFTFEVNDELIPYYVITLFDKTIGYEGNNATGVLTVNVQTGKISEYSIEEAPAWIDRIQPEKFVINQINDWGKYVHGYFNSWKISERKEVLKTTTGSSLVYGNDNKSYWYTGISSVGKDDSTVGFVLVNTRTKETSFYKQSGATEEAAKRSAEGKVQEKKYIASDPILYNISGVATYVMSLKDKEGLIKLLAMVSVEKYSIVGIGDNIQSALRSYKTQLYSQGNSLVPENSSETDQITQVVTRFKIDIKKGNSYYYLKFKDNTNIFIGTSNISEELPITKIGDRVTIQYNKGKNKFIDMISFDNKTLHWKKYIIKRDFISLFLCLF